MEAGRTVVKMRFGSHVYGTSLPTSDVDIKAVHLPSADDILLQRVKASVLLKTNTDNSRRNTAQDTDFESFSLQRFMALLLEGQTIAVNMLFTPDRWLLETSDIWERIRAEKEHWLSSGVSAFVGYCRTQANKYGIRGSRVAASRDAVAFFEEAMSRHGQTSKLRDCWAEIESFAAGREHVAVVPGVHNGGQPLKMLDVCNRKVQEFATLKEARSVFKKILDNYGQRALQAERNEGVDWKALMHAVRVCGEAEELLLHHRVTYPRPDAEMLLKIRRGELPYAEVAEILEAGMDRLEECAKISTLPASPDHARAEALVREVYLGVVAARQP